jgi:hypothetical protein
MPLSAHESSPLDRIMDMIEAQAAENPHILAPAA